MALCLLIAPAALGHWAAPQQIPVDRLVQNLTAFTKEHPTDARGWYSLGRAHSLAYALKVDSLGVYKYHDGPDSIDRDRWQDKDAKPAQAQTKAVSLNHLREAVRCLNKAIELQPTSGQYLLSLAYVLEKGAADAIQVGIIPAPSPENSPEDERSRKYAEELATDFLKEPSKPETVLRCITPPKDMEAASWPNNASRTAVLRTLLAVKAPDPKTKAAIDQIVIADWHEQTRELYFKAFTYALVEDTALTEQPLSGIHNLVTYEAAESYLAVLKAQKERPVDRVRTAIVQKALERLKNLPTCSAITPIIIPAGEPSNLASLLSSQSFSKFDLDGTARGQTWPWIKPNTGVLVWDPAGTGKITSGKQLFGSVSWWIFFENGYQALDALDDNRDGQLTGSELDGISIWTDRNSNGISDAGEVVPVISLGMLAISVRAESKEDGCPASPRGVTFSDGRVLPSYDWITAPVPHPSSSSKSNWPLLAILGAGAGLWFAPRRRNSGAPLAQASSSACGASWIQAPATINADRGRSSAAHLH